MHKREMNYRYFIVNKNEPGLSAHLAPYETRMEQFKELDVKTSREMGALSVAVNNFNGITGWYFETPVGAKAKVPEGLRPYSKSPFDYKREDGKRFKIYVPSSLKFKKSARHRENLEKLNTLYCNISDKVIEYFDAYVEFFDYDFRVVHTAAGRCGEWWLIVVPWRKATENGKEKVFDPRLREIKKSQFVAITEENVDPGTFFV